MVSFPLCSTNWPKSIFHHGKKGGRKEWGEGGRKRGRGRLMRRQTDKKEVEGVGKLGEA